MPLVLSNITIDCADPIKLSAFWSKVLGRELDPGGTEHFCSIGRRGPRPNYFFVRVPEGKTVKNRIHLDLTADDREAEIARVVKLGAKRVEDHQEWGAQWTVMQDIEGNEFCIS